MAALADGLREGVAAGPPSVYTVIVTGTFWLSRRLGIRPLRRRIHAGTCLPAGNRPLRANPMFGGRSGARPHGRPLQALEPRRDAVVRVENQAADLDPRRPDPPLPP